MRTIAKIQVAVTAMTLVQVSALIDPNAKVEIEADAILP